VLCRVAPQHDFLQNLLVRGIQDVLLLGCFGLFTERHLRALQSERRRFSASQLVEDHDVMLTFHHVLHFIVALWHNHIAHSNVAGKADFLIIRDSQLIAARCQHSHHQYTDYDQH
jgi:hypothetical protein